MRTCCLAAVALVTFAASQPVFADPLSVPGMTGPLAANPDPYHIDAGPLGTVYYGGIASGLAMGQFNHGPGDRDDRLDLDNGQLWAGTTGGPVQFYVQAGGYALPSIGVAYKSMVPNTGDLFGPVPIAYVKYAPTGNFSIQAGKLYTLIGTENTFSFQNYNVEHGLLWNQTNDLNRGIQVNYSQGPFSGSVALSDGFYSGRANWLSGIFTYTVDSANSVSLLASGAIAHDGRNTYVTPLAQDNSQLYDLTYTYNSGPWTITPTLQYTRVPQDVSIGLAASADSYGAALAGKYSFTREWSLGARAEVIDTTGGINLAYGPGSDAWSLTLTPTWQKGIYFARGEASFVKALDTTAGAAFGAGGNATSQGRLLVEAGVLF